MNGAAVPQDRPQMEGLSILLVEDEAIVALDIEDCFIEWGATVIGPFATLGDAVAGSADAAIDAAVLDVMLGAESVLPLAETLHARGIPIVFHSGHADRQELCDRFSGAILCLKPVAPETLAARVMGLIDQ